MEVDTKLVLVLIYILSHFSSNVQAYEQSFASHSRHARHLVFPENGSKVQFITGIGIPVQLPYQAVTIGYVLKSDYYEPDNGTMYTKPFEAFAQVTSRKDDEIRKRREVSLSSDRWDIYALLEAMAQRAFSVGRMAGSVGEDAGRQCILRAICETAASGIQHDGLLGELLHIVLTPSTTSEPMRSRRHIDYHTAERIGRSADSLDTCAALFSGCQSGALDLITKLVPMF